MDHNFGPKYWRDLKEEPKFVSMRVKGGENKKETMNCLLFDLTLTPFTDVRESLWGKLKRY